MIGTLVIGAEDVLLVPDPESIAASRPIPDGLEMATAIIRGLPVGRCVVSMHTTDEDLAMFWCRLNGLPNVGLQLPIAEDIDVDWETAQWHTIERVRSQGPVWLVITSSAEVYWRCSASHQAVMMYGRRGRLEEGPPRPSWAEASGRVKRHREAKVEHDQDVVSR